MTHTEDSAVEPLAFPGGDVGYIAEDIGVHIHGNGLSVIDLRGRKRYFLRNTSKHRLGISAFAGNARLLYLAFAPRSYNPTVHIVKFPHFREVGTFQTSVDAEYTTLVFSHSGNLLCGVSASLAHAVIVWSLKNWTLVAKSDIGGSGMHVLKPGCCSFNPESSEELCLAASHGLLLWKIDTLCAADGASRRMDKYSVVDSTAVSAGRLANQDPTSDPSDSLPHQKESRMSGQFLCHCWSNSSLYAIDNTGHIVVAVTNDCRLKHVFLINNLASKGCIALLCQGSGDLLVLCEGGVLCVVALNCHDAVVTQSIPCINNMYKELCLGNVACCCISPSEGKALVSFDNHAVCEIDLSNAQVPRLSESEGNPVRFMCISIHHRGLARIIAANDFVVTAGTDGFLRWVDSASRTRFGGHCFVADKNEMPASSSERARVYRTKTDASTFEPLSVCPTEMNTVSITALSVRWRDLMFMVGLATGTLCCSQMIFSAASHEIPKMSHFNSVQLTHTPIKDVIFSEDEEMCSAFCAHDCSIYVVKVPRVSGQDMFVQTRVQLKDISEINCLAWLGATVFVACVSGQVLSFTLDPTTKCDVLNICFCTSLTTPLHSLTISSFRRTAMDVLCLGVSLKSTAILSIPYANAHQIKNVTLMETPHCKGIRCITSSSTKPWIATGGSDGLVTVYSYMESSQILPLRTLFCDVIHVSDVVWLAFAPSGGSLHTSGLDMSLFTISFCDAPRNEVMNPSNVVEAQAFHTSLTLVSILQCSSRSRNRERGHSEIVERDYVSIKQMLRNEVNELRLRLRLLLDKNSHCRGTESLSADECIVDIPKRNLVTATLRSKYIELQRTLAKDADQRRALCQRIRAECWDSMQVHATECHAFQNSKSTVSNIPMLQSTPLRQGQTICVHTLRQMEVWDMQDRSHTRDFAWNHLGSLIPRDICWIWNQGKLEFVSNSRVDWSGVRRGSQEQGRLDHRPRHARVSGTVAKDDDLEHMSFASPSGESTRPLLPSLAVATPNQKRLQIVLLHEVVADTKQGFNSCFDQLRDQKRHDMEALNEKICRINEISNELGMLSVAEFQFADQEDPFRLLESFRPGSGEIAASARVIACGNGSKLTCFGESSARRALFDMMDGSLDTRKDANMFRCEVQPPNWLSEASVVNPSASQQRELDDYDRTIQLMREQQEKRRKCLALELKRLRTEICEASRVFDERVQELRHVHISTLSSVVIQEQSILQLAVSVLKGEDVNTLYKRTLSEVRKHNAAVDDISKDQALHNEAICTFEREIEHRHNDEKVLERTFRRDMHLDHMVDTQACRSSNRHKDVGWNKLPSLPAPMVDGAQCQVQDHQSCLGKVTPERQSGMRSDDDVSQCELSDLLNRKLAKSTELAEAVLRLNTMKRRKLRLDSISVQVHSACEEAVFSLEQIRSDHANCQLNPCIQILIKQGQDEVEHASVVTDYLDSVFIPVERVAVINCEIRKLGADLVKLLSRIKTFRKSISYQEWENRMMHAQVHDLDECHKDLQLLNVTRSLQSILQGPERSSQRVTPIHVNAHEEQRNEVHMRRRDLMRRNNMRMLCQIRLLRQENDQLRRQLALLHSKVMLRESTACSAKRHVQVVQPLSKREHKRVTFRRKLVDLVRLQAEEIDFLNQEVDRLRQRTFPTFVHIHPTL